MPGPDPQRALAGATRRKALSVARDFLRANGIEHADEDARALTFAAGAFDRLALLREPGVALTTTQIETLSTFLARRAAHEPASRIVGRRPFWTLDLSVRPDVLDPRADSEAMIRLARRLSDAQGRAPARILDLGAGSGALICALLAEFSDAFGVAVDLSAAACAASRENIRRCGFEDRGAVVRSDWSGAVGGLFDLVVSNPPYIPTAEIEQLDLEVRAHDPHLSLDGGLDGLDAYRSLLRLAPDLLAPGALLIFEHGLGQADSIRALAVASGFEEAGAERDLGGRDRAIALRIA
ncbi:MAG: peptide chain release factor N(5)-glutamine methyltransferase [Hyphomicrobiales bacterium]|nr:peptide chain release factor N(5)-glutamine methyltransferase [Hyphomicrobiales bacterium]